MQEVAFTFAHASAYVQAAIDAGLDVNQFGQRLSFFFNAHNDFLEEIAKFRAARRLWARIMRDRFGATNPRAQQLRFHTQTAGQHADRAAARQQHRARRASGDWRRCSAARSRCTATAATKRWRCRPRKSARIALRTQQIIAAETGVANTVDPVGGSYAIETAHRRHRAAAPKSSSPGSSAPAARWRRSRPGSSSARSRNRPIARSSPSTPGGGRRRRQPFANAAEERTAGLAVFRVDPEVERQQIERSARRAGRHATPGRGAGRWRPWPTAARAARNLVPPIIAAVEAQATVGEICGRDARGLRRARRNADGDCRSSDVQMHQTMC